MRGGGAKERGDLRLLCQLGHLLVWCSDTYRLYLPAIHIQGLLPIFKKWLTTYTRNFRTLWSKSLNASPHLVLIFSGETNRQFVYTM